MLRFDKLTLKAQEALGAAQEIAARHGQQQIEPLHLLAALVSSADGIVRPRGDEGRRLTGRCTGAAWAPLASQLPDARAAATGGLLTPAALRPKLESKKVEGKP